MCVQKSKLLGVLKAHNTIYMVTKVETNYEMAYAEIKAIFKYGAKGCKSIDNQQRNPIWETFNDYNGLPEYNSGLV